LGSTVLFDGRKVAGRQPPQHIMPFPDSSIWALK